MDEEIRVAIVEDQRGTRDGLAALLDGTRGFYDLWPLRLHGGGAVGDRASGSDVVLLDVGLPGMSGLDGLRILKRDAPALQVVVLTVHDDDDHVFEAICAGASGNLLKETPPGRLLGSVRAGRREPTQIPSRSSQETYRTRH